MKEGFASIQGVVIRVKRLDANGNPTGDVVVTNGFTRVQAANRVESGTTTTVKNAAGGICFTSSTPDQLTGTDLTIDFCKVDPELFDIVSTTRPVKDCDGAITGFQTGTKQQAEGYFSLEIWSKIESDSRPGAWLYTVFPKVTAGPVGSTITWEDGPQTWTLNAPGGSNSNWGQGVDPVMHQAGITSIVKPGDGGSGILCAGSGVDTDAFIYSIPTNVTPPEAMRSIAGVAEDFSRDLFGADVTTHPANFAALTAAYTSVPSLSFGPGDYVTLQDGSTAWWTGYSWVADGTPKDGRPAEDETQLLVTARVSAADMATLAKLKASSKAGDTKWTADQRASFNTGEYVTLADGTKASWDFTPAVAGGAAAVGIWTANAHV